MTDEPIQSIDQNDLDALADFERKEHNPAEKYTDFNTRCVCGVLSTSGLCEHLESKKLTLTT